MPLDFSVIESEVTRETEVTSSAVALLNDLAAKVEATKGDPAKVTELANALRANSDSLASAVAANTAAAPPPTDAANG